MGICLKKLYDSSLNSYETNRYDFSVEIKQVDWRAEFDEKTLNKTTDNEHQNHVFLCCLEPSQIEKTRSSLAIEWDHLLFWQKL